MDDLITRLRDTCDCGVVDEVIAEIEGLREGLAYVLRAYAYEARGVEDTFLQVPQGSRVFSVASARKLLEARK